MAANWQVVRSSSYLMATPSHIATVHTTPASPALYKQKGVNLLGAAGNCGLYFGTCSTIFLPVSSSRVMTGPLLCHGDFWTGFLVVGLRWSFPSGLCHRSFFTTFSLLFLVSSASLSLRLLRSTGSDWTGGSSASRGFIFFNSCPRICPSHWSFSALVSSCNGKTH